LVINFFTHKTIALGATIINRKINEWLSYFVQISRFVSAEQWYDNAKLSGGVAVRWSVLLGRTWHGVAFF